MHTPAAYPLTLARGSYSSTLFSTIQIRPRRYISSELRTAVPPPTQTLPPLFFFTPRLLRISSPSPHSRHLLARSSCSLASALLRRLRAPELRSWSKFKIFFRGAIRNQVELFGFFLGEILGCTAPAVPLVAVKIYFRLFFLLRNGDCGML
jgi:hypothetical protein